MTTATAPSGPTAPSPTGPSPTGPSPTAPHVSRARVVVSVLAVLGTVPYLVLKLSWLGGSRVGLLDPEFGTGTTMHVANGITFLMDAVAVLLAVAFVTRLGDRLPLPVLLAPAWVGSGLLAPVVVIVPLQLLVGVPSSTSAGPAPIADWVYAVVYAGFVWQGVFLMTATVLFVRSRWAGVAREPLPPVAVGRPTLLAGLALTVAAVALAAEAAGDAAVAWPNLGAELATLGACGAGLLLLHRGGVARRVPAVLLWTGSGAVATWGLYALVLTTVPNDLTTGAETALDVLAPAARVAAGLATLVAVRAATTSLGRDGRPRVAA